MTSEQGADDDPPKPLDEQLDSRLDDPRVQAWFDEHLTELRRSIAGHQILHWSLAIGFVVGLAFHVAGYLLLAATPAEPLGLAADLLYTFGWALWTGAVVVVFVQLIPEAKERQIRRVLKAYEAARRREDPARDDKS
jgi:hypothetical protein